MQADHLLTFLKLRNGVHIARVSAIVLVVVGIGIYKGCDSGTLSDGQVIASVAALLVGAAVLFLVLFMIPFFSYSKFVNDGSSLAHDWKHFIARRSKEFFGGQRYVKVAVTISPQPDATSTQRDAGMKFLHEWEKSGSTIHSGNFKKGRPDSFRVTAHTISGHVGIGSGTGLLIDRLIALQDLLRSTQVHAKVSLTFQNETSFDVDTEDDNTALEREMDRRWRENN